MLAYKDKNFKDRMVSFGPCQEVADLSHYKLDDGIDSIKIIDSLKILYRPPATASEDERAEIQNSEKGERKRRGKKKR